MRDLAKALQLLSTPPTSTGDFDRWTTCEDALDFVQENATEEELVVYAGTAHAFIHAVAVPAERLQKPDPADIMNWSCNATSGWGITIEHRELPRAYVSPPLDSTMSKTMDGAEQLVFARFFEGRSDNKTEFEALQKFVQVFQLHFIPERSAYCRLDSRGDLEDMIRIVRFTLPGNAGVNTVVTFRRSLIDEWLALTDAYIVQMFDFTRFRSGDFHGWQGQPHPIVIERPDFTHRAVIEPGRAGYVRGYQIIRPRITRDQVAAKHNSSEDELLQYASFIVMDWKNGTICESSCGPDGCANYFTDSRLPFETSPAFFRPDVLLKYKADSEKYTLRDRSIVCRGTWDLRTYDINEAGQVHTYLCYLRDLPYEEQLHWKAYNEAPKGTISRRAFKSDFEASWEFEYDPLESLRNRLGEWDKDSVPFWSLRARDSTTRSTIR